MKNMLMNKFKSDKAAANTTETIIIIALAVFAALALFTFVLKPVQGSADNLGQGIDGWMTELMNSQGNGTPAFDGGSAGSGVVGSTGN